MSGTRHVASLELATCPCGTWVTRADGIFSDHDNPAGRPCTEPRQATPVACGHVPGAPWMTVQSRPAPDSVPVGCPCCGMRGWTDPDDNLNGAHCPWCGVQAVKVGEKP
jgi:hypothetical protein